MRSPPFRGFPSPKKPLTVTRDVWLISSDRISTYATIAAAVAAASNGDTILIWSGTYNIATLVIDKSVTLTSLDRDNTIISVASGHSINITADNVTLANLTIANTSAGTVANCIVSSNDNLQFAKLKLIKTSGAPTGWAAGIWNFGGASWIIDGVEAEITTGASKYGYLADTAASSAKITQGSFDGATADIRLNHASALVELNNPVIENDTLIIIAGTATGGYFDGSGNYRVGDNAPATTLGVAGAMEATGIIRSTGVIVTGTGGNAYEIGQNGGIAYGLGYTRTGVSYLPVEHWGTTVKTVPSSIGTAAVEVDANGHVRKPLNSAFLAKNLSFQTDVTGDGTAVSVAFGGEIYDTNSDFNNGTGTFTAPVTGRYIFVWAVHVKGFDSSHIWAVTYLSTSNRTYYRNYRNVYGAAYNASAIDLGGTVIADMDAGDTAQIGLIVGGGSKIVDVYGDAGSDPYTYFAGELLG